MPAKKKTANKVTAKKAPKKASARKAATTKEADKKATKTTSKLAKKPSKSSSDSAAKARNGKVAAFTLDDIGQYLATKKTASEEKKTVTKKAAAKKAAAIDDDIPVENRALGVASLADILGYNPSEGNRTSLDANKVPKKFKKFYDLLVELRAHVLDEIDFHTQDTLKKNSKDDSGDVSSYSQHLADEGTDNFDRDFALSLVSSEQEALNEIEEAIQRIYQGTYGVCEVSGQPIDKERLLAVPFTRYSLEGQRELEKNKRNTVQRGGVFGTSVEDSSQYIDDDGND